MPENTPDNSRQTLHYYGGVFGALVPFILFAAGVVAIALSGAPDERGFWPVLILALTVGLLLARERKLFCDTLIKGMSQPIVMIMISAWMIASIIGIIMAETGFVEALIWTAASLNLSGLFFTIAAFLICCLVSISTGTSFGTILICGPLLYPAGLLVGAPAATLAGAILGGATFGDCIAPISDTTIASALSQNADIGGTVRSRLKYVIPAGFLALACYGVSASLTVSPPSGEVSAIQGSPKALPMILIPILIIVLLLMKKHLLEALLIGLLAGAVLGLILGLLQPAQLLTLDAAKFTVKSIVIDGINRTIGISIFTILLLGLVATLKASGLFDKLVQFSLKRSRSIKSAESWIVAAVSSVVLLTCHSIVAILTVADFTSRVGQRMGVSAYRRANLLSLSVSTYPFILPYFIPVILMANTTRADTAAYPPVSPLQAGLHNFFSWALLLILIVALVTGFGRLSDNRLHSSVKKDDK